MINSFTFYFDYYNLIDTLPLKDKEILLVAITDYMFKDIEPNLKGHNQAIFNTLKAQLNVSKLNSKRRTKEKPKEIPNKNQKETENKPNKKPQKNKTSIFNFKFYISNFKFINNNLDLINKIDDWFNYKQERKDKYTEIGIKTLLKKIDSNVEKYGSKRVIDLIDESISNNYQGIIWDKLNKMKTRHDLEEEARRRFLKGEDDE